MIDNYAELYTKYGFLIELLVPFFLFIHNKERRRNFAIRLTFSLFICFLFSTHWPDLEYNYLNIYKYLIQFLLLCISSYFCFNINVIEVFFYGVAAYAIQHCGFQLNGILHVLFNREFFLIFSYIIFVFTSIILYRIFSKSLRSKDITIINRFSMILISFIVVLITDILNYVFVINSNNTSKELIMVCSLYAFVSCQLALFLQFGILEQSSLKKDRQIIEHMWKLDQQNFDFAQSNIELINLKCHDLKHQIEALRQAPMGTLNEKALSELDNVISVYDSFLHTKNEVLDTILSQKTVQYLSQNIHLTCMINESQLNFIDSVDLYSILGNILDNARDAVIDLPHTSDKKIISLSITKRNSFIVISTENYYQHYLQFVNQLPRTTKSNTDYHGYGLKSVRMIVQKYNGNLTIKTENNIFYLNIIVPIP